jgi:pimeloyl-ACP methyl ester carboxylesterase
VTSGEADATSAPRSRTLTLADGRALGWFEFGDPTGVACLYTPGTPESGLAGGCYDRAARDAKVRWISLDKPGYGRSDPKPRRRLVEWPDDLRALADHLDLDRFAVAGESGGGPHALAAAAAFGERVTVTVLLASMGPSTEPWAREGLRRSNRVFFALARMSPLALRPPLAIMRRVARSPRLLARIEAGDPPADRAAAHDPEATLRRGAAEDAFAHGTRPVAEELAMLARPWGFDLGDVAGPTHLWHGDADVNVPIGLGYALAAALGNVVTHFVPGAGHSVGFACRDEVLAVVAGAA